YSRRVGGTPGRDYRARSKGSTDSTRIISNPCLVQLLNAAKFSGRNRNKLAIGVFNAVGAATYAEIENIRTGERERMQTEPLTNYNLIVLDQALKGRSSITLTNANVIRFGGTRNSNVTGLDLALFEKTNRYALQAKFDYSQIMGNNPYNGFKSFVNFGKVSGKWQFSINNNTESDRYDPNDLGILRAPNEFNTSARISYNQLTPRSVYNSYSYSLGIRHEMLYKPFVLTNMRYSAGAFWFYRNFWDLSINAELQPLWEKDYFELRTPGLYMRKVPWGFLRINGSTDSRKKLFARFNLGLAESVDIKNDPFIVIHPGVRYRFNDRLSLDLDVRRTDDQGQFGYAFRREANGEPIIGRRRNLDVTGLLTGIYNFTPRMNLTLRARHYWNRVTYQQFFNLANDGFWKERTFIDGLNQNVNLWNVDVFFTWDFNYGSRFVLGWKNWLANDFEVDGMKHNRYFGNATQTLLSPHGNEFTARIIFFIDYLKLKRRQQS
ncbi:MAG TPA: DUF5916 domain-containing protein, partial [Lacibacter sp.]|nr:DUF5916 domain-containing protein [Lacibacter sp.]